MCLCDSSTGTHLSGRKGKGSLGCLGPRDFEKHEALLLDEGDFLLLDRKFLKQLTLAFELIYQESFSSFEGVRKLYLTGDERASRRSLICDARERRAQFSFLRSGPWPGETWGHARARGRKEIDRRREWGLSFSRSPLFLFSPN